MESEHVKQLIVALNLISCNLAGTNKELQKLRELLDRRLGAV